MTNHLPYLQMKRIQKKRMYYIEVILVTLLVLELNYIQIVHIPMVLVLVSTVEVIVGDTK